MPGPPLLCSLRVPYVLAARDVRGAGVYEDLFQINTTTFAAANQRFSMAGPPNDYVMRFYWAGSLNGLLAAVYGCAGRLGAEEQDPPGDLLLAPNCCTYSQVLRKARETGMACLEEITRAHALAAQPFVGRSITVGQRDYYFLCSPEEWVEKKAWDRERIVAVAVRTARVAAHSDGEVLVPA